jgi:hypothetical protein
MQAGLPESSTRAPPQPNSMDTGLFGVYLV